MRFILQELGKHCQPQVVIDGLQPVLADDTELFGMKLWRALIFHTLQAEAGT